MSATVGGLFARHGNADGLAEPPAGERWAVWLDLHERDVLAIYGPALARRADAGPFAVALAPARGLPGCANAEAGKPVTVRPETDS